MPVPACRKSKRITHPSIWNSSANHHFFTAGNVSRVSYLRTLMNGLTKLLLPAIIKYNNYTYCIFCVDMSSTCSMIGFFECSDTYLIQVSLHCCSLTQKKSVPPVQLKHLYKTNGGKEAKLIHTFNSLWQRISKIIVVATKCILWQFCYENLEFVGMKGSIIM